MPYFDCVDSIAGEVEIPSKKKQTRFQFEKENYTDFEIANMMWDKIAC